jgi:phosphotransferase system enzyme I (PtsP)
MCSTLTLQLVDIILFIMLNTLQRITQGIQGAQDFDEALLVLVQRVREALDVLACSIFLVDRRSSEFVLLATKGLNPRSVGLRVDMNSGLLSVIARKAEPINLANVHDHEECIDLLGLGEESLKGFIGIPIIHQRNLYGVLVLHKQQAIAFSDKEEAFLITLSASISAEIAHAESAGLISHLASDEEVADKNLYSNGIPSAPGVGIGKGVIVFPAADLDAVPDREIEDVEEQLAEFRQALCAIREDIQALSKRLETNLSPEDQALFDAYLYMLDDNGLGLEVEQQIRKGNWAQGALRIVIKSHVRQFESMENDYLRERAEDVRDLGQRILARLQEKDQETPHYPKKTVLVGEEITAADLAGVPVGQLMGVVSGHGSSSSHVAILARALSVPAVMGVEDLTLSTAEGQSIIVDGYYGHVYSSPSDILLREFSRLAEEERQLNEELQSLQKLPAETTDHHTIQLMVNTGLAADLGISLSVGAAGVGLYRTEVPFLAREMFPSSNEQRKIYRQLLMAFSPRPVTMRTLDIGGDKPLSYFPIKEDNPFLGWRGIRVTLDHPEIFLMQIRAMLRANEGLENLKIMLPMISDVKEVDEAHELIQQAHSELLAEGFEVVMPQLGIMIEVPSAVHQIHLLAKKVSFVSVGSNDLTQYILAVDRNNSRVAGLYNSLHPAVLSSLQHVVKCCQKEKVHVSICGEMAGDPAAALVLLGLGFDCLSMSAARLSRVKWVIRQFSLEQVKTLVAEILTMDDAVAIRNRLESVLDEAGLGGLIRAGRY